MNSFLIKNNLNTHHSNFLPIKTILIPTGAFIFSMSEYFFQNNLDLKVKITYLIGDNWLLLLIRLALMQQNKRLLMIYWKYIFTLLRRCRYGPISVKVKHLYFFRKLLFQIRTNFESHLLYSCQKSISNSNLIKESLFCGGLFSY